MSERALFYRISGMCRLAVGVDPHVLKRWRPADNGEGEVQKPGVFRDTGFLNPSEGR